MTAANDRVYRIRGDCRPQYVLLAALFLLLLLVTNPVRAEEYWHKDADPVPYMATVMLPHVICRGLPAWECTYRTNGIIYIQDGISDALRECLESHGKKHLQGYTHDDRSKLAADCGDGRIFPL